MAQHPASKNHVLMTSDSHHVTSSWPPWKLLTSSRPLVAAKNAPKRTRQCISLQHQGVPAPTSLKKSTHHKAILHPSDASGRVAAILPGSRMLSINPSIRQSNCSHASHAAVFRVYRQKILNVLRSCVNSSVRPLHGETALLRA